MKVFVYIIMFIVVGIGCTSSSSENKKKENKHYISFSKVQDLQKYLSYTGKNPLVSAHRGGPMPGYPENAIETFENTLTYGACILEFDVSKTSDGVLILMHDDTLDRTTNGTGKVAEHTWEQLQKLKLKDNYGNLTEYKIPTFEDVLNWGKTRAVMSIDVKKGISATDIIAMVHKTAATANCIIIVYNWDMLKEYHRLDPNLMISASAHTVENVKKTLSQGVPPENLLMFVGVGEPEAEVYKILHDKGIRSILGTMHNLDNSAKTKGSKVYVELLKRGADILATDNVKLATEAVLEYERQR